MRADMKKGIEKLTGFIFIAVEEFGVFKMVGILLVLNDEVRQFLIFFGQLIRLAGFHDIPESVYFLAKEDPLQFFVCFYITFIHRLLPMS
jgi:hypothetical protein